MARRVFASAFLRSYDDGIKRNPKDAKLYSNRAACLNKLGAAPDALKDLDKCLELDPKFVRAYARAAGCEEGVVDGSPFGGE